MYISTGTKKKGESLALYRQETVNEPCRQKKNVENKINNANWKLSCLKSSTASHIDSSGEKLCLVTANMPAC